MTTEPDVAAIPDERMRSILGGIRPYTVVILRQGPNHDGPDADALVWAHGKRNLALRADGRLAIVMPIGDPDAAGLQIFAIDAAEVRELMETDPAIRAGVLEYRIHIGRSFPGDALP